MATKRQIWYIMTLLKNRNIQVDEQLIEESSEFITKKFLCNNNGDVYEWFGVTKKTGKPYYEYSEFKVNTNLISIPEASTLIDRLK